ncbi:MAG TPA: hypothetical protein VGN12_07545 [Pirellulales bacterium]|jgi:hypothetical protein
MTTGDDLVLGFSRDLRVAAPAGAGPVQNWLEPEKMVAPPKTTHQDRV